VTSADGLERLIAAALGLPAESVGTATTSADLDAWDSLGHLRILMALEDELGVTVDVETAAELDSVAKLREWLLRNR
jgi:citrate synthase